MLSWPESISGTVSGKTLLQALLSRTPTPAIRLTAEVAVFSRLFDANAPMWRAMSMVGDIIVLNLLTLITCLPVITVGASMTALYDTARRVLDGTDSGAARTFWFSFRSNLRQATLLWAVVGPVAAAVLATWIFVQLDELLILKVLLSVVFLLIFPFVWALQARFVNTPWRTLGNAAAVAFGRLPYSGGALIIRLVIGSLAVTVWMQLPQAVIILVLLGYPLAVFGAMPLIERALEPLLPTPPLDDSADVAAS